jgi:hypothetical protein
VEIVPQSKRKASGLRHALEARTTAKPCGKHLTAIHFGSGGFSGNQVVFGATFSDDLI